ncbi:MOSC domain-containing protein [Chitinimonas naiadis]
MMAPGKEHLHATSYPLLSLRVGRSRPFGPQGQASAILKQAVSCPIMLGSEGFLTDEQGDRLHHGGPEKAVHHYPFDHYPDWAARLAGASKDLAPGAFGENLSTRGMTEADVCIGDQFALGQAVVELSQPRQPCWKLNVRFATPDMARLVQASRQTGWYYRVLVTGLVSPTDTLRLLHRPCPDWPLSRVLHTLFEDTLNPAELERLIALQPLAPRLRTLFERRLASRQVEDWSARLTGSLPSR